MKNFLRSTAALVLAAAFMTGCSDSPTDGDFDNSRDLEYLEEHGSHEDVTVTESGLQYRIEDEGNGEIPGPDSDVKVHYTGFFISGQPFYSTGQEPAEFNLSTEDPDSGESPILGLSEGIQLMQEGAQYLFVLPSDLAYGDEGYIDIYPGATLIFQVELVEVL